MKVFPVASLRDKADEARRPCSYLEPDDCPTCHGEGVRPEEAGCDLCQRSTPTAAELDDYDGCTLAEIRRELGRGDLCFVRGGGRCVTEARAIERHRALEFESRVRSAIADFRAEQVEADSAKQCTARSAAP